MNIKALQIVVTVVSTEQAEQIIDALFAERLIACAQVSPAMRSYFRWQDAIQSETEFKLVLKTQAHHFHAIEAIIKALHSYDVPEILAFDAVNGAEDYLTWIKNETT